PPPETTSLSHGDVPPGLGAAPVDRRDRHRMLDAFESQLATFLKPIDVTECLSCFAADQDLAGLGERGNARRDMHAATAIAAVWARRPCSADAEAQLRSKARLPLMLG